MSKEHGKMTFGLQEKDLQAIERYLAKYPSGRWEASLWKMIANEIGWSLDQLLLSYFQLQASMQVALPERILKKGGDHALREIGQLATLCRLRDKIVDRDVTAELHILTDGHNIGNRSLGELYKMLSPTIDSIDCDDSEVSLPNFLKQVNAGRRQINIWEEALAFVEEEILAHVERFTKGCENSHVLNSEAKEQNMVDFEEFANTAQLRNQTPQTFDDYFKLMQSKNWTQQEIEAEKEYNTSDIQQWKCSVSKNGEWLFWKAGDGETHIFLETFPYVSFVDMATLLIKAMPILYNPVKRKKHGST